MTLPLSPLALVAPLRYLEQQPIWGVMAKEFFGVNVPRIAITRTNTERMDTAVAEIGNLVGFFGTGFLLDKLLNGYFNAIKPAKAVLSRFTPKEAHDLTGEVKAHWKQLGKTVALCGFLAAWMVAIPFLRNYVTASHSGQTAFTEVITKKRYQKDKTNNSEAFKHHYLNVGLWTMGAGVALVAASMLLGRLGIKRGLSLSEKAVADKPFLKAARWLKQKIGLKEGKFEHFGDRDFHPLLFWVATSYSGMLIAARDRFEVYEQLLKCGNFVLWFSVLPAIISRLVLARGVPKAVKPLLPKTAKGTLKALTYDTVRKLHESGQLAAGMGNKLLKIWRNQELLKHTSSIVLLGATPNAINIGLTRWRLQNLNQKTAEKESGKNTNGLSTSDLLTLTPQVRLQKKPFSAFTHQAIGDAPSFNPAKIRLQ